MSENVFEVIARRLGKKPRDIAILFLVYMWLQNVKSNYVYLTMRKIGKYILDLCGCKDSYSKIRVRVRQTLKMLHLEAKKRGYLPPEAKIPEELEAETPGETEAELASEMVDNPPTAQVIEASQTAYGWKVTALMRLIEDMCLDIKKIYEEATSSKEKFEKIKKIVCDLVCY